MPLSQMDRLGISISDECLRTLCRSRRVIRQSLCSTWGLQFLLCAKVVPEITCPIGIPICLRLQHP